jgi:hypothetical protein
MVGSSYYLDLHQEGRCIMGLKVRDEVEHNQYPGKKGLVVGIKKRDNHSVETILVHWWGSKQLSHHTPQALKIV